MSTKARRFTRCVVVVNPNSSNYDRGQRYIRQLTTLFPLSQMIVIELRETDYERPSWLISRLNEAIGPHTLLALAGGDGTNNLIIETLLTSSAISEAAYQAVILPLWAGNANDLATMANGNPPESIKQLIKLGAVTQVHPLEVSLQSGRKTTTRIAACYVSIGASAYASARISDPSHRKRRLYRLPGGRNITDIASISRAFLGAPTFKASFEGVRHSIYDFVMINGPRVAKISRIPIELTDLGFYEIIVGRRNPLLLSYLIQIALGARVAKSHRLERTVTIHEPNWVQIDGEALKIPGQTKLTVRSSNKVFPLLATKLLTP